MSTTQADLNKLAAKLAAIKVKQEALAKMERDLKDQALDILENVGFTTVDCPKRQAANPHGKVVHLRRRRQGPHQDCKGRS
jgi:hypothetical protein